MKKLLICLFYSAFLPSFLFLNTAKAENTYLTSEQFIAKAFNGKTATAKVLWLNNDDKNTIEEIMSHPVNFLRIRYWQADQDTVWIIDEIGKDKPITIGVHISNAVINEVKVLVFRESRGDEVRHEFFTKQFVAAKLTNDNMLDQHIDGITGATMSVRALTKVARLSLWLHHKVMQ